MRLRIYILLVIPCTVTFGLHAQTRYIAKLKPGYQQELRNAETLEARLRTSTRGKKLKNLRVEPLIQNDRAPAVSGLFLITTNEFMDEGSAGVADLFEYIEPDHIGYAAGLHKQHAETPADPAFGDQWYLYNDGTFPYGNPKNGADIQILDAWNITQGDSSIIVAILDSGINPDHPEFHGRLWKNRKETEDNKDNDRNGFTDDMTGWDFVNSDNDPRDDNNHGTAVAGVVAANANNNIGFAGIDQRCKLMICKVLDHDLSGFYSHWIAALYYAVENGAMIINFSLGGAEPSRALQEAIAYAESRGVLVVAAMQNFNTDEPYYPAAYSEAIAVGSTDPDDMRSTRFNNSAAYGSNYGDHIDVVAPGNYIFGLDRTAAAGSRFLWGGTSMASPVVSGVAALLLAQDPSRTARELRAILYATSEDQVGDPLEDSPGWDRFYGYGRVNAFYALSGVGRTFIEEDKPLFYPNPAQGQVTFRLMQSQVSPVHISLWNSQGMQVAKFYLPAGKERVIEKILALHVLPAGVYLVRTETRFLGHTQRLVLR